MHKNLIKISKGLCKQNGVDCKGIFFSANEQIVKIFFFFFAMNEQIVKFVVHYIRIIYMLLYLFYQKKYVIIFIYLF